MPLIPGSSKASGGAVKTKQKEDPETIKRENEEARKKIREYNEYSIVDLPNAEEASKHISEKFLPKGKYAELATLDSRNLERTKLPIKKKSEAVQSDLDNIPQPQRKPKVPDEEYNGPYPQRKPTEEYNGPFPLEGKFYDYYKRGGIVRGGLAKQNESSGGLLASSGSGRKDILPRNVRPGSYVIPADVVSALGDGNTLAGAKILDRMMGA